jgi:SAM-dependent methyltransferase
MDFGRYHKVGLAICTPHRGGNDVVTVAWHRARNALHFGTNLATIEFFADGLEIGTARSGVARRCLEHDPRPEFLLFLDDDVISDTDAASKLLNHLRWRPDVDIAAGVYCCKGSNNPDPLIYAEDGAGPFWDWAVGDILTSEGHGITATHMGLTLIRVSLFQRMLDAGVVSDEEDFFVTRNERERVNGTIRSHQSTEDIDFYTKARQVGVKILVDTSVLAGHQDKRTGTIYGLSPNSPPVQRAKWLTSKDKEEADEEKLALDLGAGGTRRQWPGYKTYTLDIRPDSKPDYCQDTRQLNFPDGHWDLIASSHHLEHIGRWDQETVWREMARVLKPGGTMEHIVPSLDWAGRKLAEGEIDEHVLNVLYGAQEAHGYAREFNLHYFGYTKDVARALAEQAGLVDVECEDWRDRPELGYNLVLRAKKPALVEPSATMGETNGAVGHDYGACTRPKERVEG